MGDWLYMSAFEASLSERSLPVLDILTAVTRRMTEGEILQLTTLGSSDVTEEQYFDILMRKTAYLFSACGEIGAMLGSTDVETQLALRSYGMNLGAAFQLVDDLLDFTATDDALGKAAGVDLLEGKLTLPLIYLLETEHDRRAAIQTVMREGTYDAISRASLTRAAEQSGALDRARRRANDFAAAARNSLDALPDTKYREALSSIPTFILERDR
jgi:octaprenyl-diphosphate synthase